MTNLDDRFDEDKGAERPFPDVLAAIFEEPELSLPLLYRLTDLSGEQMVLFESRWDRVGAERRLEISRHLADITEDNFVVEFTPVFRHLLNDPLPAVRRAALDGMWDCTNTAMIRPVITLMQQDADLDVRAAAAATLAHFVLMAEWGQLPKRILPRIETALLAVLDEPKTAVAVRRSALEAIGSSSHERVPDLIQSAYDQGDEEMQLSAVFAMGASADRRWMPTILMEMKSPRPEMRAEAARAAGSIGSSDALDRLRQIIVEDDVDVALAAVQAVGAIGGGLAQEILQSVLDDEEAAELHEAAADAMEETTWMDDNFDMELFDISEDDS